MCDCECTIGYSSFYKELIHVCPLCQSTGGTLGNVNHDVSCKYIHCIHCRNYDLDKVMYCDFFKNYNKDKISNFKKKLKEHINDGKKIIYRKQLQKINWIIEEKTGKTIFYF